MITLLDTLGPAIWRASWQATALAILIWLLLYGFGERLAPRWRFLLWSVVITRLLFVATPVSPWSVFNLVRWHSESNAQPIAQHEPDSSITPLPFDSKATNSAFETTIEPVEISDPVPESSITPVIAPIETPAHAPQTKTEAGSTTASTFDAVLIRRILSMIWLTICLLLFLKLLAAVLVLRRRLSACRPVTDASLLELLETACRRIGLKRTPALLVTPGCFSPCTVGIWRPRIVLPEAVATESSPERLNHVLAHELAHLVRRDLWTNWLLLFARILHWFNPVAWWTVREMQAEREAACDDLAFASLGESARSAYAATIVELATSLTPPAIMPGLVGFLPSRTRLKSRIERFMRSPSVKTFTAPVAAGLLFGIALLGLTDAMPGEEAQIEQETAPANAAEKENNHTISGRCVNDADRSPLAGISVRLYKVEGRTSLPVEVARTVTDVNGVYTFTELEPPRPENHLDRLNYGVFGFADDLPIGISFFHFREDKKVTEIRMTSEKSSLWESDRSGGTTSGWRNRDAFVCL